jgi:SAM-dependent methyltransferase
MDKMRDLNIVIKEMLERDSTGKRRPHEPAPPERLERLEQLVTDLDGKTVLSPAQLSATNVTRISSVLDWVGDEKKILDVGGGSGLVAAAVLTEHENISYLLTDISESFRRPGYMPKVLRKNEDFLNLDNFTTAFFDVDRMDDTLVADFRPELVLLLEVLEHVPNPEAFLAKLRNHLEPGARVVLTVPLLGQLELVKGHVNVFTTMQLLGIFGRVGFKVFKSKIVANQWGFWMLEVSNNFQTSSSEYIDSLTWVEENGSEELRALMGARLEYKEIAPLSLIKQSVTTTMHSNMTKNVQPRKYTLIIEEVDNDFSGLRFWLRISGWMFWGSVNLQFISNDGREVGLVTWELPPGQIKNMQIKKVVSRSTEIFQKKAKRQIQFEQTKRIVVFFSGFGLLQSSLEHAAFQTCYRPGESNS